MIWCHVVIWFERLDTVVTQGYFISLCFQIPRSHHRIWEWSTTTATTLRWPGINPTTTAGLLCRNTSWRNAMLWGPLGLRQDEQKPTSRHSRYKSPFTLRESERGSEMFFDLCRCSMWRVIIYTEWTRTLKQKFLWSLSLFDVSNKFHLSRIHLEATSLSVSVNGP